MKPVQLQRVRFLKATSGYTDCRTLRYFEKGETCKINDSLVKNFLSTGSIQILEDEEPVVAKVADPVVEDKTDKKVNKRRKKKAD